MPLTVKTNFKIWNEFPKMPQGALPYMEYLFLLPFYCTLTFIFFLQPFWANTQMVQAPFFFALIFPVFDTDAMAGLLLK